jgi:hypothetical protein
LAPSLITGSTFCPRPAAGFFFVTPLKRVVVAQPAYGFTVVEGFTMVVNTALVIGEMVIAPWILPLRSMSFGMLLMRL